MRSLDAGQAVLDTERAELVALAHEVIRPEAERSLPGTARWDAGSASPTRW
ncbi:hypothetical protein [Mycobacterium noviomagense]|nr:hypothetical protein [Mycobacterium noviomagense]